MGRTLASTRDLEDAFDRVLKTLVSAWGATGGTLLIFDEKGEYQVQASYGLPQRETPGWRLNQDIITKALEADLPSTFHLIGKGSKETLFCAPIRARGENKGMVCLYLPFSRETQEVLQLLGIVSTMLGQAMTIVELEAMPRALRGDLPGGLPYGLPEPIIGQSPLMERVMEEVKRVASSKATVLLRGESGTGKELIAKAIHYKSPRAKRPFVKLNCAALPETLLEAELFGHEKGAFTGALREKRGRFELAHGGTLFLDEIGDLTPSTQVKLLRVLQEKKFERLGGMKTISVDVRIIAATNRDLERAVKGGSFREDLYYRLNVVPIILPPLRERKEDIPLLVGHFLERFNRENGKKVKISAAAMDLLMEYPWPGNVRELENCVERMVVMARRDIIAPEEVPLSPGSLLPFKETHSTPPEGSSPLPKTLEDIERERIAQALKQGGGVQAKAARLLGITPRQLGYKLKKYRIEFTTFL